MTRIALLSIMLAVGTPVAAEDKDSSLKDGMELLSEGTRLLIEGLIQEMQPALDGLGDALSDLNAYHPPEILPNGDIILRRKEPLEDELEIGPDGEVEI
ncbi:MAG: hypothetical protein AAF667_16600 [Pseudomonadota bacterium]